MKKIMFNDKFLLTQAVLDGRKTQTRRLLTLTLHKKAEIDDELIEVYPSKVFFEDDKWKFVYDDYVFLLPKKNYPKYDVGEVVAVAQSYNTLFEEQYDDTLEMLDLCKSAGWSNKMFVRAELMPHQIRITNVRIERLQDISDEDCLKESVVKCDAEDCNNRCYLMSKCDFCHCGNAKYTPREAYAALIDKVGKKGTWDSNPYVFVYDFELVK